MKALRLISNGVLDVMDDKWTIIKIFKNYKYEKKYEANLEFLKSPSRVVKGKDSLPPLEVKQLDMYAHLNFQKYFNWMDE